MFGGIADCAFGKEQSNWIMADMRYSYGRACTVARHGTVMEGTVLSQGMAQLWKGMYCCKAWHSYGKECTVARQWHTSKYHKKKLFIEFL